MNHYASVKFRVKGYYCLPWPKYNHTYFTLLLVMHIYINSNVTPLFLPVHKYSLNCQRC